MCVCAYVGHVFEKLLQSKKSTSQKNKKKKTKQKKAPPFTVHPNAWLACTSLSLARLFFWITLYFTNIFEMSTIVEISSLGTQNVPLKPEYHDLSIYRKHSFRPIFRNLQLIVNLLVEGSLFDRYPFFESPCISTCIHLYTLVCIHFAPLIDIMIRYNR